MSFSQEQISKLLEYCQWVVAGYKKELQDNNKKNTSDYASGVNTGMYMAFQVIVDMLEEKTSIPETKTEEIIYDDFDL